MDVSGRLAGVHERIGNARKAIKLYKKILRQAPSNVNVRCRLAKCFARLGEILAGALASETCVEGQSRLFGLSLSAWRHLASRRQIGDSPRLLRAVGLEFDPNHAGRQTRHQLRDPGHGPG